MQYNDNIRLANKILWDSMQFRACKEFEARQIASAIIANKARYENVNAAVKKQYHKSTIPWYFIGLVHKMECNLSFRHHLHNGDSLEKRTVRVPAGRPTRGNPPFTFVESAVDALHLTGATNETDWSIPKILFRLEGYNGYGYRMYRNINSPYLWAGSNHYTKGKYVEDGKYDSNAVSQQIGVALVLKHLLDDGVKYTTANVNIREGSSADHPTVAPHLSKGTKVKILTECNDWSFVEVIGTQTRGWVSSKYLF